MPIQIYLVDDYRIFQDEIAALISFEEEMEVISMASSSIEKLMLNIKNYTSDLITMDIPLGDGKSAGAAKWWKEKCLECKMLMLSMHRENFLLKTGAKKYGRIGKICPT